MNIYRRDQLPERWRILLAKIQEVDPSAILAGGALRDLDHGREIKDLDFFVNKECDQKVRDTITNLSDTALVDHPGSCAKEAVHIIDGNDVCGDINIIYVVSPVTPKDYFAKFDFGICQIMFDGKEVNTTPNYSYDSTMERFTLLRATDVFQFMDSINRYKRLKAKYVGWDLVIPGHLELPDGLSTFGRTVIVGDQNLT